MKIIKDLVIATLMGAFVFALFYLIGAFSQVSFDVSTWNEIAQSMVSVMGGVFGLAVVFGIFGNLNDLSK